MRILYVTNGFPYPLTSGFLRHYFLIRELSSRHAVSLLSIVGADFRPEHGRELEPFTERVLTFASSDRSRSLGRKAARRVRSLLTAGRGDPVAAQLGRAAAELLRTQSFDAILFSGKRTYPALASMPGLPVVADLCDAASQRIRGHLRFTPLARRPFLWLEYADMRRIERALVGRAAHVLFASCRDRDALLGPSDRARSSVVPNGVDVGYWTRRSPRLGRRRLVFTGAMSYPPNEDAALHLIGSILPRLRRHVPDVGLALVGRDPTPRLRAAGARAGVEVTGLVDDVRPWLEQASVFVAPLRFGAGIQNKVLEAMAMQVPSVVSSLAADGLRDEAGPAPPLGVADDPDDFVRLVIERLQAAETSGEPDAEARAFVERGFVWKQSGDRVHAILERVVEERVPALG